ncbi:MAG TPA: NAD(P)-dependent alcohol dehydrogenase, partial [Rhodospirillales bacterium]|nr:NAD(P)-dependent alcohol dehydrogenase [Rhodospirillales bacterium]
AVLEVAGQPMVVVDDVEIEAPGVGEVAVAIAHCGICHSDLSMIDNEWGFSAYPLVPGHEVIGTVAAVGEGVDTLRPGQTVGLGWYARSCMHCEQCMSGDHNLCAKAEGTIVGRHGGFADKVRAHAPWVLPLPDGLDPATSGPLFCGGITVFNPIVRNGIRGTDRVGVIGIGGLGHIALRFLHAWGCEVTAFSTSADKEAEARSLGADRFVVTRDPSALTPLAGTFDMILVTLNVGLDWDAYIAMLRPRGKLHFVGAVPSITAAVFPLLLSERSVGGSPLGSPATTAMMLTFAARHGIAPVTEDYPMSRVNDAIERLRSGRARYRIVLRNDLDG